MRKSIADSLREVESLVERLPAAALLQAIDQLRAASDAGDALGKEDAVLLARVLDRCSAEHARRRMAILAKESRDAVAERESARSNKPDQ